MVQLPETKIRVNEKKINSFKYNFRVNNLNMLIRYLFYFNFLTSFKTEQIKFRRQ